MTDKPTPTDAELQSIIDDADAGPPTDKEWLCLECGRWTPWRHEEAHDHADGCKAPAIYAAKRDWKTRLKDYMAKWGQPAQAGEPVAWLRNTTDPQPHAVTNLKYRSAVDAKAGVEYIPVFAAHQPVAREPLTDEQIKALMQAHRTAMLMTCKARVPECGEFAAIAQDLDLLCESFGIKGGQHGTE